MNLIQKVSITLTTLALAFTGCKPKPLTISVPQAPAQLTLSAAVFDEHSVFVSAGYSVNSLQSLKDTAGNGGKINIPEEMALKDAVITLTESGRSADTLFLVSAGLYGNRNLQLHPGATYTLEVWDRNGVSLAIAGTTYFDMPVVEKIQPVIARNIADTVVSLRVKIGQVQDDDHYMISYTTLRQARMQSNPVSMEVATLASFSPKQLTLCSAKERTAGCIEKEFAVEARQDDTLVVLSGKIDQPYFNYLTIYKRSGSLINQLTGEPIHMPTNIVTGLGFFSLFAQQRTVFYLKEY